MSGWWSPRQLWGRRAHRRARVRAAWRLVARHRTEWRQLYREELLRAAVR